MRNLKAPDGKILGDHLALLIGTVGENTVMRRAICFKTNNDLKLAGYAHPQVTTLSSTQNVTQLGKYGTIVALRSVHNDEELQKNLCQHIVGLNPQKIGEFGKDEPNQNKDEESCLIHQEFLIDEEKTVGEILAEHETHIVDYQRYECGEPPAHMEPELEEAKIQSK